MDLVLSEPSADALQLNRVLGQYGLSQYEQRLMENGFDTWETVTGITEADMTELGFKLGDRRKLQRAIREQRSSNTPKAQCLATKLPLSFGGLPVIGAQSPDLLLPHQTSARSRRPYRRHPRADHNAPQRPKTAYVLFSEHVRNDPAVSHSSFAEIAKEVGRRWGTLDPEQRADLWEKPAAKKIREYKAELERYKKTENYRSYQTYLEGFKRGYRKPGSTVLPDNKSSPKFESAHCGQSPALLEREGSQARQGESGVDDSSSFNCSNSDNAHQKSGMEEVRQVLNGLGVNPQYSRVNAFPSEDMTNIAVEAFLHGTGSLLYLWDHDEALDLVKSVYHSEGDSTQLDATELFAMAAIGSYCDGEANIMSAQENFLHFFISMLSSPLEMCDLRRMRLFTSLAICRFTNSVESARSLMLSALRIGRQTFTSPSFLVEVSQLKAHYWWNIFRSVVFIESWFAYNTGYESRITEQDLTLYRPSSAHYGDQPVTFHQRVGELGQLAAYIALDLKKASQPKVEQAKVHFESLNRWHRTLPPPMQLSRLSLADPFTIAWHTKRSILQLHILFLGLFVEPYRTCLVDLGNSRLDRSSDKLEDLETMKNVEKQCISAAQQSARVASLLQIDNLIRSHCWVSLYTSFTGCSILLFSASQKLLSLDGEEVGQDLLYASAHLSVLSLCSYNSGTAKMLYTTLQIVFNDIREVVVSPAYRAMREMQLDIKDKALVPLSYYDAVEGAVEISKDVLDLARRVIHILQESIGF